MSADRALRLAQDHGVEIRVEDADLLLGAESEPPAEVLDALRRYKAEILGLLTARGDELSSKDGRAILDERAAIAEFDGGLSRSNAHALAYETCITEWMSRHHTATGDPLICAWCGETENEDAAIVPFGSETRGHTWLHPECWPAWYRQQRGEAVAGLEAAGVPRPVEGNDTAGA